MKAAVRHIVLAVLAFAAVEASDWKSSKFPEWSDDTVLRLLTDSPWTKPKSVHLRWHKKDDKPITYKDIPGADPTPGPQVGSPVGGIGGAKTKNVLPDKADILIRWSSSLPIRHAMALYQQRDGKLDPRKVTDLIPNPTKGYVLEVFNLPVELAHQGTGMVETLMMQNAVIRTKSGRTIHPAKVDSKLSSSGLSVFLHFQPEEPIRLKDNEIEFEADFQVFWVKERFKLSQMMYQNRLEL